MSEKKVLPDGPLLAIDPGTKRVGIASMRALNIVHPVGCLDAEPKADLLEKISRINPQMGHKLKQEINLICPKLIINQVRTQSDIEIGNSMKIICKKYFGLNLDYVGHLEYDATVWQSVKKRKPLLTEFPNSDLVANFDQIVQRLLNWN